MLRPRRLPHESKLHFVHHASIPELFGNPVRRAVPSHGLAVAGSSTPACWMSSPMLFSSSSMRDPISSMRPMIESDMVWKRVCICCSRLCTNSVRSAVPASPSGAAAAAAEVGGAGSD